MIYCNLAATQLSARSTAFGIYKNNAGYYKKEDLDKMMSGAPSEIQEKANQIKLRFRK